MNKTSKYLLKILTQDTFNLLKKVVEDYDDEYACVKGEFLSKILYGKEGQRHSSDIDILVPRNKIHKFELALQKNGFQTTQKARSERITLLTASHQVSPWVKNLYPWGAVVIDLNFSVLWGEYEGSNIDINNFISDSEEIFIYGNKFKTLSPIKTLLHLILHHYKDMNSIYLLSSRNSIRYDMFQEVYLLLHKYGNLFSPQKLYDYSALYNVVEYVYYVLYYTNKIFPENFIKKYVDALKTQSDDELIEYYGLCAKERKKWRVDFFTRLETEDLYSLIKDDLTIEDQNKILLNKKIFEE